MGGIVFIEVPLLNSFDDHPEDVNIIFFQWVKKKRRKKEIFAHTIVVVKHCL